MKKLQLIFISFLLLISTQAYATLHTFGGQTGSVPLSWLDDNFAQVLADVNVLSETPQKYGAVGNGIADDTVALNAWLAALSAGGKGGFCTGTFKFTSALSVTGSNWGFTSSGGPNDCVFSYAGATTTSNLMTIGDGTTEYDGVFISGLRITSTTAMSAGSALLVKKIGRSTFRNVWMDGQDGAGNLWNGFYFDAIDSIQYTGVNNKAQNNGIMVNGTVGAGLKSGLWITHGRILGCSVGLLVGGGFGGLYVDDMDIIANNENVRVDHTLAAEGNRELFFGINVSLDSPVTGKNLQINDSLANTGTIIFAGWNASSTGIGINIASWPSGNVQISSGRHFNNTADAIYITDTTTNVVIGSGVSVDNNGGWGVDGAATTLFFSDALMFANTSGNCNVTNQWNSGNSATCRGTGGSGGGSGKPGGNNLSLQYNNNGVFGGSGSTSINGDALTLSAQTNTANIILNGKTATDFALLTLQSNATNRAKFISSSLSTFLDSTGTLYFRDISGAARANLDYAGDLALSGTLSLPGSIYMANNTPFYIKNSSNAYVTALRAYPSDNTLIVGDGFVGGVGMASLAISGLTASMPVASDANKFLITPSKADFRTLIGVGTIATQAANNVAITGGSITGITDLAVADGGTGLSAIALGSILAANSANTLSAVTSISGTKYLQNVDGVIAWGTGTGGGGSPGGDIWQIQYNNTSFAGSPLFTITPASDIVSIIGQSGTANLLIAGKTAGDFGELTLRSNSVDRAKFLANSTATWIDATGTLYFRTVDTTARANMTAAGTLNLAGTLTAGTPIVVGSGGSGLATVAAGSILAAQTLNTMSAVTSVSGTKYLKNADGTISWDTVTSAPGGSNTYVQYNNSSAFGGSALFTLNTGTEILALTGQTGTAQMSIGGKVAADWGLLTLRSAGVDRAKFLANSTATWLDATGTLYFRDIAGTARANLNSSGSLALNGPSLFVNSDWTTGNETSAIYFNNALGITPSPSAPATISYVMPSYLSGRPAGTGHFQIEDNVLIEQAFTSWAQLGNGGGPLLVQSSFTLPVSPDSTTRYTSALSIGLTNNVRETDWAKYETVALAVNVFANTADSKAPMYGQETVVQKQYATLPSNGMVGVDSVLESVVDPTTWIHGVAYRAIAFNAGTGAASVRQYVGFLANGNATGDVAQTVEPVSATRSAWKYPFAALSTNDTLIFYVNSYGAIGGSNLTISNPLGGALLQAKSPTGNSSALELYVNNVLVTNLTTTSTTSYFDYTGSLTFRKMSDYTTKLAITNTGAIILNNNIPLEGKNYAGTAKILAHVGTDDDLYYGALADNYLHIGAGATQSNPVYIHVGGADRQVVVDINGFLKVL